VRRAWPAVAGVAAAAALAVAAALAAPVLAAPAARAASPSAVSAAPVPAPTTAAAGGPAVRHVVIVGISGLRWNQVTAAGTPALWRLAGDGSVGSLVDYAQQPLSCPADGWLTLNSAARAQGPRPCGSLPEVTGDGAGATVPTMAQIIAANRGYHESPDWGLLGSLASCSTAVGPGAALALASATGAVSSYLPSAGELSAAVLARCPLTVVDLGQTGGIERTVVSAIDRRLARIVADLPAGTLLLVTSPGVAVAAGPGGGPAGPPHLMATVVSGPGFADGLLDSSSTRQPGIVTLTDLTTTVAGWLGRPVPAGTVGAQIGRTPRGDLAATIRALLDRDTAEQVWLATHGWFLIGYALADAVAFGLPALLFWGATGERRRARARCWRIAGVLAASVPLGSYLANLFPWWRLAHPAWWLYGLAIVATLVVAAAAVVPGAVDGRWRRDPVAPFGLICLATLALLALDAMTGSRLQPEAPFGLSLLVSGRYYGIGNDVLGVYCVSALVGAAWLGSALPRRPAAAMSATGLFAVVALGWPGFGAKVGGTIALVPCLVLLVASAAGRGWARDGAAGAGAAGPSGRTGLGWRWAVPIALSGVALFAVFALVSYFLPAAGRSDIGTFAGNLLRGNGGGLIERKASSNVGTLTVSAARWLIPAAAVAAAVALWRPSALRLRTLSAAFESAPAVRTLSWLCWLVLIIGWLADDSGVVVPAAALPFAVPVVVSIAVSVSAAPGGGRYGGMAFAGSSVARAGPHPSLPPTYDQPPK
jgi:hypothetical protein